MSVTESKTKTERKSSRKPSKEQETALSALLAQTAEVSVPLASLIKSPLNVRTVAVFCGVCQRTGGVH